MRQTWPTPGGVHPPENKSQSNGTPIETLPLAPEFVVPLNQHLGAEASPCVAVGDKILKGQIIGRAQGLISAPVHAPTSGTVTAIALRPIAHPSGLDSQCIIIESDGDDRECDLEEDPDYLKRSPQALLERIREAGISGMGGAGFPTAVKLKPRADQNIHTLIINGTECEPYITADDRLMRERAEDIVLGAELCAYILGGPETLLIGVEDNKPEAIKILREAARERAIEVVSFPTKYPSGGEKQLVEILTGEEVPTGGLPAQLGIVVQNVATVAAAYRAARYGEPLISRVTTVVGEALGRQGNIDVRLGTPIEFVLRHFDFDHKRASRVVIGGPMMGYSIGRTDVPVVKTTNCILVPTSSELPLPGPAQSCIRCGMCAEACPASLLPQQLFWFAQAEEVEKLKAHHLFDCIECGACSYVCPSRIPLVQYYRASKGMIRQLEVDKRKSDRARERFEARQVRLAQAEAEKAAKREARKRAAAQQAPKPPAAAAPASDDRARLERAVSSAENRLDRAKSQLVEADEARKPTLEARVKQAELKLKEAQDRLSAAGGTRAPERQTAKNGNEAKRERLQKQLAVAEEKLAEAEQAGSATVEAIRQGVAKLQTKLSELDADAKVDAEQAESQSEEDSRA